MLDVSPPTRVIVSWSTGKDSVWTLHVLRQIPGLQVIALLTTFDSAAGRVAMHSVRRELALAQAKEAALPLWPVELPWPCSNEHYEWSMQLAYQHALQDAATHVAFGDLFLQDIREYRERQLANTGLKPLFPLWQFPTNELARTMIREGVRAKIACVDLRKLDTSFAGREFDDTFLDEVPGAVDACGENGEFHTFVYDAPVFRKAITVEMGAPLERAGFVFSEISLQRSAVPRSATRTVI